MIYEMKLNENEFDNVKYRGKVIEVRINDEKRKHIYNGDKIIFHKITDREQSILVNVEQVYRFNSFKEIYESFPISYFGYTDISIKDMIGKIYKIYTEEEEKNMGVVAIKFNIERIMY